MAIIKAYNSQIQTLLLTYRFRYSSATLLARLRKIDRTVQYRTLETLYQKGLLNRKYDKSYKLLGKPASYSLNITGVNYLKERMELNKNYAHTHYKNATHGERFINENLDVLRTYIILSETHPETFTIFTKAEMTAYSDKFPRPLPHLYLNRTEATTDRPNYYMLDLLTVTDKKVIAARIDKHIKHFDDGDWEEDEHPTILLVLADSYLEKEALKMIEDKKDNAYIEDDDLVFMTTTIKALFNSSSPNIWTSHKQELASL